MNFVCLLICLSVCLSVAARYIHQSLQEVRGVPSLSKRYGVKLQMTPDPQKFRGGRAREITRYRYRKVPRLGVFTCGRLRIRGETNDTPKPLVSSSKQRTGHRSK